LELQLRRRWRTDCVPWQPKSNPMASENTRDSVQNYRFGTTPLAHDYRLGTPENAFNRDDL
jgi:hypothetical protein